jgi:hypothetical protein
MTDRICSSCGFEKPETGFRKEKYKKQCRQCLSEKSKEYNKNNREDRRAYSKQYQRSSKRKKYLLSYYKKNAFELRSRQKTYENKKYVEDPLYRMRKIISASITKSLKSRNLSKKKNSFLDYVNFSMQELKEHLEKQFEPWMNWHNRGKYDSKTWNDSDPNTWTWQIDHIIPHSTFQYTSMEDRAFKECWSLSNLRPYSSKQNIIDGSNRTRHIGRTTE